MPTSCNVRTNRWRSTRRAGKNLARRPDVWTVLGVTLLIANLALPGWTLPGSSHGPNGPGPLALLPQGAFVQDPVASHGRVTAPAVATLAPSTSRRFVVSFVILPAGCGPLEVNGTAQANNSEASFLEGSYSFSWTPCTGMGPVPSFQGNAYIYLDPTHTILEIDGNGTLVVTYFPALTTSLTGPTTGTIGNVLAFRVIISGGNLAFTEEWSFGDNSRMVNTSGATTATHIYNTPGTYLIQVWVNDTEPELSLAKLAVTVTGTPGASESLWTYVVAGAIVIVAAVAVLILLRSSKSRPGSSPPPEPGDRSEKREGELNRTPSSASGNGSAAPGDQA